MWYRYDPPAAALLPDEFLAACGLPFTPRPSETMEQFDERKWAAVKDIERWMEEQEEEEGGVDPNLPLPVWRAQNRAQARRQHAYNHAHKVRLEYGPPLVLDTLPTSLRTAFRSTVRLQLENVSVTTADLSLLLSCTPRLRSFRSGGVKHVSVAALLLLARHCPLLQHISLVNTRSQVLSITKAQLDAAEHELQPLSPPLPPPPSTPFRSLQSLEVQLADYETDTDEAGFAQLVSLLAAAPLRWVRFSTMAALPAASFALLAQFDRLQGLDMACCCRPSVFALLYGDVLGHATLDGPRLASAVSLYTEATDESHLSHETANCTRRFLSPAARAAFFDAVAALPSTPDERVEYVAARCVDVDEWPKGDIGTLLEALPREKRRDFFGGDPTGFDSEDE